jgi:hypothetical protein
MLIPLGILSAISGAVPIIQGGYFAGGLTTVAVDTIDKLNFSTEAISTLGTGLPSAIRLAAGMSNSAVAGYTSGGFSTTNAISKLNFAGDTVSTLAATLSVSRYSLGAMANSGTAGYIANGNTGSGLTAAHDKLAFSTETRSTLTNLPTNQELLVGMANSGTAGYYGGGEPAKTQVRKVTFSNDSISTLGTGLSVDTYLVAGMADTGVAGYFCGGYYSDIAQWPTKVDKFAFPSDTRSILVTGLSVGREGAGGVAKSGTAGYVGGGNNAAKLTSVDKFAFPSDTRTTLGAALSSARSQISAMSSSGVI